MKSISKAKFSELYVLLKLCNKNQEIQPSSIK